MAYDPKGALNGLFAPSYIAGNQESDAAVQAWTVAHPRSPGVGTFVPDAVAAQTPVAQTPEQQQAQAIKQAPIPAVGAQMPAAAAAAPAAAGTNDAQRNQIAQAIMSRMNPTSLSIWQQNVSPGEYQNLFTAAAGGAWDPQYSITPYQNQLRSIGVTGY